MSKRIQKEGQLRSGSGEFSSELCSKLKNDVTSSSEFRMLRSEGGELRTEGGEYRTEGALRSEEASDMSQQLQVLSKLQI